MAKYRSIETAFWQDRFTLSLDPIEKYFYFYLMTNTKSNQLGCYQLPIEVIAFETGLEFDEIEGLIEFLWEHEKISYDNETGEIFILNWHKYNWLKSVNTLKCIVREFEEVQSLPFRSYLYDLFVLNGFLEDEVYAKIFDSIDTTDFEEFDEEGEQAPCKPPISPMQVIKRKRKRKIKRKTKIKRDSEVASESPKIDYEKIISHLNSRTGKSLRSTTDSYRKLIKALVNKNYTEDDLIKVIDIKADEWLGTKYEKYLQPSTLFRASKFEEYLNQQPTNRQLTHQEEQMMKLKEVIDHD